MTVLILASELDASVDGMIPALAERGVSVHRVNTGWFPTRMQITAKLRGRWRGRLTTPRGPVELDEVTAVWYRSPEAYKMPPELSPGEAQHARVATHHLRQGGATPLWDRVEWAFEQWQQWGEPSWEQFGLTVTPERRTIWLDNPAKVVAEPT